MSELFFVKNSNNSLSNQNLITHQGSVHKQMAMSVLVSVWSV